MKKIFIVLILILLFVVLFTACDTSCTDLRSVKANDTYNMAYYKLKDNCYLYIQIQEAKFIVSTNSIEVIDVDGNKIILPATETILMHKEAPTPDPRLPDVCFSCKHALHYYPTNYSPLSGNLDGTYWIAECTNCHWILETGLKYNF